MVPPPFQTQHRREDRIATAFGTMLTVAFVIAFSARPIVLISNAGMDDALFIRLGRSLAAGQWLGPYDELTFVKGIGFPVFLALVNLLGLPFLLANSLVYAGSAAIAARAVRHVSGSATAAVALLFALLLLPVLSNGELLRVYRDLFYASLSLSFVATAVLLVTGAPYPRWILVPAVAVLGAWVWLTREEGIWLFPCVGVLALVPLTFLDFRPGTRPRLLLAGRALAPLAAAAAIAATLVFAVGLVNWAYYGRFELNEFKDGSFQAALTALEEASAPFHREGIPVPRAARERIYKVSPAFASLKEPLLDGPATVNTVRPGCDEDRKYCDDIGGGWFLWDLRTSAALRGEHVTPVKAARFYRKLAREVRDACKDGRLVCQRWFLPMVPPMTVGELSDVGRSVQHLWRVMTFRDPVIIEPRASTVDAVATPSQLAFLNNPQLTAGPTHVRTVRGWFVSNGPEWFNLEAAPPVEVLGVSRFDSPDIVQHFANPQLERQRFGVSLRCPILGPCPVTVRLDDGRVASIDFAGLSAGATKVQGATLYVDAITDEHQSEPLKNRFSRSWIRTAAKLGPAYRLFVYLGLIAYPAMLFQAVARRRLSPNFIVCTALLAAVAARCIILGLIDALSFPAAYPGYALAGFPLLLMACVIAVAQMAAQLKQRVIGVPSAGSDLASVETHPSSSGSPEADPAPSA